ncbi:MAG TPA: response regulator [Elusimicrobiales bacterium]|nr:response regulator [Elusimicrobiales bacterium]
MTEHKYRILVADDDAMLLELAFDVLSAEAEYEVTKAVDGQDAWEKAQATPPDLVITDLMMPRMHGYELCEKLKGQGGIKGVRVLVASSKTFSTDKAQAEASGADGYIVKPYSPSGLLQKVAEMLSGTKPVSAPRTPGTTSPAAPAAETAAAPAAPHDHDPIFVRFWGTRGSCPVSSAKVIRYGGNTACAEVRIGNLLIILDCGTGLRDLGAALLAEFRGRPIAAHIFVGHTHWDHIQGFPFFTPLFNPHNIFSLYSVHGAHGSLESVFSGSMASDYFPIPLVSLAGKVRFIEMSGPVDLGAAKVSFCHLNHPGVCIGFRIEGQGHSICYLSDHEAFSKQNGENDMSRRQDEGINAFVRGCDLLIREAQYTEAEYAPRRGWGHSTFDDAVRGAVEAGVKKLAIIHHDPEHTDDMMDEHIAYCRALAQKAGSTVDCFAARDGLRIDL